MNLLYNLTISCDAPQPWGDLFQDNTSPQMEALTELHDYIMFYLVIILFGVAWIIASTIVNYISTKFSISNKYFNYGTLIKLYYSLIYMWIPFCITWLRKIIKFVTSNAVIFKIVKLLLCVIFVLIIFVFNAEPLYCMDALTEQSLKLEALKRDVTYHWDQVYATKENYDYYTARKLDVPKDIKEAYLGSISNYKAHMKQISSLEKAVADGVLFSEKVANVPSSLGKRGVESFSEGENIPVSSSSSSSKKNV